MSVWKRLLYIFCGLCLFLLIGYFIFVGGSV